MDDKNITLSLGMAPAEPLWKVAPTRDADGNRVSDLLMIIPRLKTKPKHHIQKTLSEIELALNQFRSLVLFANVDMKLNTLWVSFKARPGLFVEITSALKLHVPEAVIVGDMSSRINTWADIMESRAMDTRAYNEMKSVMGGVLQDLINTFLEYMPGQLEDLSKAINDKDADLVFGIAHRIKSSSNSLGALGLAETAQTIELIGRAGKTDGAREHFNTLRAQLEEVMDFLKQELEQL